MLSKKSRATASSRRYSSGVASVRPRRWLFSGWYVHGMKDRNPPVRSCTSRIIRRCSMRSAFVSPVPIMKVAVDCTPSPWAVSITSSHTAPVSLSGAIACRGRSVKISAPAPANESSPAACSRVMTSAKDRPDVRAMCTTSDPPSECSASDGYAARTAEKVCSYHSIPRSGLWPPCSMICVAPSSTASPQRRRISSTGWVQASACLGAR